MTKEQVTTAEADREAAADSSPHNERWGLLVRAGHLDADHLVQAFARHRLTSQAELVSALEAIADGLPYERGQDRWLKARDLARLALSRTKGETE